MVVGAAWPVNQPSQADLAVATPPAIGAGARDAHLGRDMGDGTASRDALAQHHPSGRGQPGVSVGHEDLRLVSLRQLHHAGGPHPLSTTLMLSTTSGPTAPAEPAVEADILTALLHLAWARICAGKLRPLQCHLAWLG